MANSSNPDFPMDSNRTDKVSAENQNSESAASLTKRKVSQHGIRITENDVPTDDLWLRFRQNLHTLSSTVFSFILHFVLLLVLGFYVFSQTDNPKSFLTAEISSTQDNVLSEPHEQEMVIEIAPTDDQSILEEQATDNAVAAEIPVPSISLSDENEPAPEAAAVENNAPQAPEQNAPVGGGLEGRSAGSRSALASTHGGTTESELAVENGLRWLANHQQADGSWRLSFSGDPCNSRCSNSGTRESPTAATGLTLMAFLGAGYTHQHGPYQEQVQNGLDFLVSRMRKSIFGGNLSAGSMYAQGIATIALSEAYSMTKDESLRETVELAMEYIVTAQHSAGGWRYAPGEPGDTTVTGWQMMALKSCELAGIDPPPDTIKKVKKFLATVGDDSSGLFGYQDKERDPTSTAVGLLLQMYLGWSREHRGIFEGTNYLVKLGPSENNIYFNYYATLTLFQARHHQWETWNAKMREYLIQTQSTNGHESGSWFFKEQYGSVGGRLYTTAMAVMILEVYYRYLPLFDQ